MSRIAIHSAVALLEDIPSQNLAKGQIGTVVEYLERSGEEALLIEFADSQGRTYALAGVKAEQLIFLPQIE